MQRSHPDIISRQKFNAFIIPQKYGGQSLDRVTLSIVTEEIGYGCAGLATVHAVSTILIGGSEKQKKTWLPLLLGKDGFTASCCITEEKGGSDTSSFLTKTHLVGKEYVINGSKGPAINSGNAAFYVVWASSDEGKGRAAINAFIVPKDTPGISYGPYQEKPGLRCVRFR